MGLNVIGVPLQALSLHRLTAWDHFITLKRMNKSEVYKWRLSPLTKAALEEAARKQNRSIADLLEEIVSANLGQESDAERQRALHTRAAEFAGCLAREDSRRAERARERVQNRLKRRNNVAD